MLLDVIEHVQGSSKVNIDLREFKGIEGQDFKGAKCRKNPVDVRWLSETLCVPAQLTSFNCKVQQFSLLGACPQILGVHGYCNRDGNRKLRQWAVLTSPVSRTFADCKLDQFGLSNKVQMIWDVLSALQWIHFYPHVHVDLSLHNICLPSSGPTQIRLEHEQLVRNDTYPDELQDRLVGLGLLIWKLFATNGCPLDYTASLVKEKIISAGRRVGGGNQAENQRNRILFPIKVHPPSVEKIVYDCWEMKPTCQIYTTIKEQLYSFLLPALPTPPLHLEICVKDLLQKLGADPGSSQEIIKHFLSNLNDGVDCLRCGGNDVVSIEQVADFFEWCGPRAEDVVPSTLKLVRWRYFRARTPRKNVTLELIGQRPKTFLLRLNLGNTEPVYKAPYIISRLGEDKNMLHHPIYISRSRSMLSILFGDVVYSVVRINHESTVEMLQRLVEILFQKNVVIEMEIPTLLEIPYKPSAYDNWPVRY
eukprot:TRINITY_DN2559_c0_g1_i13.p1 TRINITY_DN2559_c0_g1~~TRINITY_DN2559_c0_g1_i13.p1  ORF type:complete len:476 (+),score=64.69 TRINITY_DN2559_c0_g1_i13:218-1645(+)